jgi:hypothetical protein
MKTTKPAAKKAPAKKTTPQPQMTVVTELPKDAKVLNNKPAAPAPAPAADLTLGDIQSFRSIIEIASTRGAFRAEELAGIGQLYGRLDTFLKAQVSE